MSEEEQTSSEPGGEGPTRDQAVTMRCKIVSGLLGGAAGAVYGLLTVGWFATVALMSYFVSSSPEQSALTLLVMIGLISLMGTVGFGVSATVLLRRTVLSDLPRTRLGDVGLICGATSAGWMLGLWVAALLESRGSLEAAPSVMAGHAVAWGGALAAASLLAAWFAIARRR